MKPDTVKKQKTSWHRLLAKLLELVLSQVKIEVLPDVSVMTDPPEADILLLRRLTARWTAAQRALLPDGIRDSKASHILIEFKYTKSFNEDALAQAIGYDFFYKQAKQLSPVEMQTVILSAKTPRADTLELLGFKKTKVAGVYRSKIPVFERILLLVLNDLSNEPHNAGVKYFSSRQKAKQQALQHLKKLDLMSLNNEFKSLICGLRKIWAIFIKGGTKMRMEYTPEEVMEFGKEFGDVWLAGLTPSELLKKFTPSERMVGLKPSERLAGLKSSEIEDYIKQLKKREHA